MTFQNYLAINFFSPVLRKLKLISRANNPLPILFFKDKKFYDSIYVQKKKKEK